MNKLKAHSIIILFLGILGVHLAHAECNLTITANPIALNWEIGYTTQAFQFSVQKNNTSACNYWLGFSKGGGTSVVNRKLSTGSSFLPYQLYKDNTYNRVLMDPSDAPIGSEDNIVKDQFTEGTGQSHNLLFYFHIPSNGSISPTLVKNGSYTDVFTIYAYEGTDPLVPNPVAVTSTTITATVTVPSIIKLSLVSPGAVLESGSSNKSIDFGIIAPGLSGQFDIRLYTNAGFNVTFSSENNGRMLPPDLPGSPGIPYLFYANENLLDLSNSSNTPVLGLTGTGQTTLQGVSYPIRVRIANYTNLIRSGKVKDVITITAITTE